MRSKTSIIVSNNGKSENRNILISQFYEHYYTDTPQNKRMNYKEFESICKNPFLHFIRKVNEGHLYELRLKYIGKFSPSPATIITEIKNTKERFKKEYIPKKIYDEHMEMLKEYIEKEPKLFKKWNYLSLMEQE